MPRFLSIGEAMVELSRAEGDFWKLGFAGDTLNTAWYARAALPSAWRVEYLTRLGQDPFSPRMLDFLEENGIGTDLIARDPQRSVGLYSIELVDGERHFAYWRGESAARGLASDAGLLDRAFAGTAQDVIYCSGITLAILPPEGRVALLKRMAAARDAGRIVAFDPNIRPRLWEDEGVMRRVLTDAAATASIAFPSFDDEAALFGDASPEACADRWREAGAAEVVVKNGGGAMVLADPSGQREIVLERVRPVDSTGAGDAFNGAYLAARLTGAGPDEAAAHGHAMALRVIAWRGALIPMADLVAG